MPKFTLAEDTTGFETIKQFGSPKSSQFRLTLADDTAGFETIKTFETPKTQKPENTFLGKVKSVLDNPASLTSGLTGFGAEAFTSPEFVDAIKHTKQLYEAGDRPVVERGNIGTKVMLGEMTHDQAKPILKEYEAISKAGQDALPKWDWKKPGTWTANMYGQGVQLLPYVKEATLSPKALEMTAGGALLGGAVPGIGWVAGMGAGAGAGAFRVTTDIEGGNAYLDLLDKGISHEVAAPIARTVGVVNGLIETASLSILAKYTPLKALLKKSVTEAVEKNPVLKDKLLKTGLGMLKDYGAEIGQEVSQEVTQIAGEAVSAGVQHLVGETEMQKEFKARISELSGKKNINPEEKQELDQLQTLTNPTFKDQIKRIGEIALKTAQGVPLLMLPGGVHASIKAVSQQVQEKQKLEDKAIEELPGQQDLVNTIQALSNKENRTPEEDQILKAAQILQEKGQFKENIQEQVKAERAEAPKKQEFKVTPEEAKALEETPKENRYVVLELDKPSGFKNGENIIVKRDKSEINPAVMPVLEEGAYSHEDDTYIYIKLEGIDKPVAFEKFGAEYKFRRPSPVVSKETAQTAPTTEIKAEVAPAKEPTEKLPASKLDKYAEDNDIQIGDTFQAVPLKDNKAKIVKKRVMPDGTVVVENLSVAKNINEAMRKADKLNKKYSATKETEPIAEPTLSPIEGGKVTPAQTSKKEDKTEAKETPPERTFDPEVHKTQYELLKQLREEGYEITPENIQKNSPLLREKATKVLKDSKLKESALKELREHFELKEKPKLKGFKKYKTPEELQAGEKQAKTWEVSAEDYIARQRQERIDSYQKGIEDNKNQLEKVKSKKGALAKELLQGIKTWTAVIEKEKRGENDQKHRIEYIKTVKQAISQGIEVSEDVINQFPELTQKKEEVFQDAKYQYRYAKGSSQAKEKAKEFVNKPISNSDSGIVATVSNESLGKLLSSGEVKKSVSPQSHMWAVANLDKIFGEAAYRGMRPDKLNLENVNAIQHFVGAMMFEGKPYFVKIMAKEYKIEGVRIYLSRVTDVEKPPTSIGGHHASPELPTSQAYVPTAGDFSTKIARLLEKVKERAKKDTKYQTVTMKPGLQVLNGEKFDIRNIPNKRFMYAPNTGELILGENTNEGKKLEGSHAEDHGKANLKTAYDDFVKGWVGAGKDYPQGIIHFHFVSSEAMRDVDIFNDIYSTLEMFVNDGQANEETIISGLGRETAKLGNMFPEMFKERYQQLGLFDKVTSEKYSPEQLQALAVIEKIIPNVSDYFKMKLVEAIVQPNGRLARGAVNFTDKIIRLSKMADETTGAHEAFHIIMREIMRSEHRREILDAVKKEQGFDNDLKAEEWIADAFADYWAGRQKNVQTLSGKIKQFLEDIVVLIKSLFSQKYSIEKLFYDLRNGIEIQDPMREEVAKAEREYRKTGLLPAFNNFLNKALEYAKYQSSKVVPIFTSKLERIVEEKMQGSMSADQLLAMLRNNGVKQDELDWSGLQTYLKEKGKVTKEEVQDLIDTNRVKVEEVKKGEKQVPILKYIEEKSTQGLLSLYSNIGERNVEILENSAHQYEVKIGSFPKQTFRTLEEAKEYVQIQYDKILRLTGRNTDTKFFQYQLPGGENYREVLLTLPTKINKNNYVIVKEKQANRWHIEDQTGNRVQSSFDSIEVAQRWIDSEGAFRSSHWDEPNVLAHFRLNDRITEKGKTLFIEEIQSDWHQKGREKGYQTLTQKEKDRMIELQKIGEQERALSDSEESELNSLEARAGKDYIQQGKEGVPNAPFKKTWHELALKRILRMATEEGYDAIAWTTGEQQADRYDLSRVVRQINVKKGSFEGTKIVEIVEKERDVSSAFEVDESGIIIDASEGDMNTIGKNLSEVIGKDLAQKIQGDFPRYVSKEGIPPSKQIKTYSGLDLKVGGEGMKGFYDQILPSFLNKYTKKWGGRVGETYINRPVGEAEPDITGEYTELVKQEGAEKEKVHALEITPAMKDYLESVPQELFQDAGDNRFEALTKDSIDHFEQVIAEEIGHFEELDTPQTKEARKEFKLSDRMREIIKKYAVGINEKYVGVYRFGRECLGVFHNDTNNIFVQALNDITTAVHEVTHYLSAKYGIAKQLMRVVKTSINGNPIYDYNTAKERKALTAIYVEYYPGAKKDHKLFKRLEEGLAVLVENYVKHPTEIEKKYPELVNSFLKEGGKFYQPVMKHFLNDMRQYVREYQSLSPLEQIGSRVTEEVAKVDDKSVLNVVESVDRELADNVYPLEKLDIKAGTAGTKKSVSLYARMAKNAAHFIIKNLKGKKGFWSFRGGDFIKTLEFNWRDLVDLLHRRAQTIPFGNWLVSRRVYFDFMYLDKLRESRDQAIETLKSLKDIPEGEEGTGNIKEAREEAKRAIKKYQDWKDVLRRDAFDREIATLAYLQNKQNFEEPARMYDALVREDLKLMHDGDVQLITDKQYNEFMEEQGYASFKRDFYNEIVGQEEKASTVRVGKTKVSSLLRRKGSQLDIVNPIYSSIRSHAEVMKKSLKQVVYNKMLNVVPSFPQLFQIKPLKVNFDPETGKVSYPQERDENYIMAMKDGKRVPILTDSFIKKVIDELYTYHEMGFIENLLIRANRMFTKSTTGMFVAFAPVNVLIDQFTALAQTRNNYVPILSQLNLISRGLLNRNSEVAKYWQEYLDLGGEHQTFVGWQDLQPGELFKEMHKEREGLFKVLDVLEKGTDLLAMPSKYSEIVTRATEYTLSRMKGKSQVAALEEAGRVTAPFHHIGKWGKGTLGKVWVRSLPFFNASLQVLSEGHSALGTKKLISSFLNKLNIDKTKYIETESDKLRHQRALFVSLGIVGAMVGSVAYTALLGSDDQKDQLKNLEPEELANYLWFPRPSGYGLMKFKMPNLMSPISTLINMFIIDTVLNAKYTPGEYVQGALAFVPDQFNITSPVRMFYAWIPQLFKPTIETMFNKRTYPEVRPIVGKGLEYLPKPDQYYENTAHLYRWVGEKLNMSPALLEHFFEGYMGRATRPFVGKPEMMSLNPAKFFGLDKAYNKEFYLTAGRQVQDYYERRDRANQVVSSAKKGERDYDQDTLEKAYTAKAMGKTIDLMLKQYRESQKSGDKANSAMAISTRNDILDMIDEYPIL